MSAANRKRTQASTKARRGGGTGRKPAPKKGGGFGGVIFLAVALAAAVFLWKPIRNAIQQETGEPGSTERRSTERRTTRRPRGGEKPVRGSRDPQGTTQARTTYEDDEADRLFREAADAMRKTDFASAAKVIGRVGGLNCSPEIEEIYKNRKGLVTILNDVDQHNPVAPESRGEGLYSFTLSNGQSFRGLIESETLDMVKVMKDNGIKVPLKRSMIKSQTPVGRAARRAELKAELKRRKAREKDTSEGRWKLAAFAFRSDLRKEAMEILRKAWHEDSNLASVIFEGRAKQVLREWLYYKMRDIPSRAKAYFDRLKTDFKGSKALLMATDILREEGKLVASLPKAARKAIKSGESSAPKEETAVEEDPVEVVKRLAETRTKPSTSKAEERPEPRPAARPRKTRSSGGASGRADAAYAKGMRLFNQGAIHPDATKGRQMIADALEALEEAERLYEELLQKDPGNGKYEQRLGSARRKRFLAGKFVRVG
ncbi:MAG: hypothetical protein ACYTGH_11890 [Planctomycetota bacterium]|jgi:tetratricopeptide (TPR) repeat protein